LAPAKRARELLTKKFNVVGPEKPVVDIEEIPAMEKYDALIVFVASGGTSDVISRKAKDKRAILWTYDKNNSLPSALEVKERLEGMKAWIGEIVYNDLSAIPSEIVSEVRICETLRKMSGAKIGLVGDEEDLKNHADKSHLLTKIFGINFVVIPMSQLITSIEEIEDISEVLKKFSKMEIVDLGTKDLAKAARFYAALKRIMRENELDVVTIDCFKFMHKIGVTPCVPFSFLVDEGLVGACEADLKSTTLMLIFQKLTKRAWIGNLAQFDEKRKLVTLAHCTAATTLADEKRTIKLKSHFESGAGVSIDVPLRRGEVTIVNFQLKPSKLVIAKGEIIDSQMEIPSLCRTQAQIRLADVRKLMQETGNHHVLAYGDFTDVFKRLAERLKINPIIIEGP